MEGARLLLNRLSRYKNWFPCLMQVLRDDKVKLGHVAEKMQEKVNNLKYMYPHLSIDKSLTTEQEYPDNLLELRDSFQNAHYNRRKEMEKAKTERVQSSSGDTLSKGNEIVRHGSNNPDDDVIRNCIRETFVKYIDPDKVLWLFHKYDINVLTEQDIENVRAGTSEYGRIEGAQLLLLSLCNNWFPCLMQVLRDDEVKLGHVAEVMQEKVNHLKLNYMFPHFSFWKRLTTEEEYPDDDVIRNCIRETFVKYIDPDKVLWLFHKYNINVLTPLDIELVRTETFKSGRIAGAQLLLDRLSRYKNWFPCLMQVLRDDEVKLGHVAEIMHNLKYMHPHHSIDKSLTTDHKNPVGPLLGPTRFQSAYSSQKEKEKAKIEDVQSTSGDPRFANYSKDEIMDEQNAQKIRASRGNKEAEVSFTGEASLHQRLALCKKNPHHLYFISVEDFNIKHLPLRYHDNLLVKYVRATSYLTCRLSVPHTRENRTDIGPDRDHVMFGTGWVERVMKFTEEDGENCQCKECCDPGTETPKKTWGVVYLMTASSVVCNNDEARHTNCHFFYDSYGTDINKVPTLTGFKVVNIDIEKDWCEMTCVTHNMELLDKLYEMCEQWRDLRSKVHHKYLHNKYPGVGCEDNDKHDLCVIVSHPHGCHKFATVGKVTQRQLVRKDDSGHEEIKYNYDTPTCPGSGGALVITLVDETKLLDGLSHHLANSQGRTGNHEAEVTLTQEAGVDKILILCKKNRDHKKFIAVNEFNIDHLPHRYRDKLIVGYVKATSDVTCRLSVTPGGDEGGTGGDSKMVGTGLVDSVVRYTEEENEDCKCQNCCTAGTGKPLKTWGVVYMWTACHVVNNDEVARHTQCHLFYDSHETDIMKVPTLTQFKVVCNNIREDWTEMMVYTHNMELLDTLHEMLRQWHDRRDKMYYKYLHSKYPGVGCDTSVKHDLCIIVSHPHGCTKTVSVGKCTDRQLLSKDNSGNEEIKYSYDTPTCPGSSGALVTTLVENIKSSHPPVHSEGRPGNENNSGVVWEQSSDPTFVHQNIPGFAFDVRHVLRFPCVLF